MTGLLIVNIAVAMLVVASSTTNEFTRGMTGFYLVTMCHAIAAAAAALTGLVIKRRAFVFLVLSSVLLTTLPVSCFASGVGYFASSDRGGIEWVFAVGSSSLLAMVVGAVTALIAAVRWSRIQREKAQKDLNKSAGNPRP